jgi:hypothetical protein
VEKDFASHWNPRFRFGGLPTDVRYRLKPSCGGRRLREIMLDGGCARVVNG